MNFPLEDDKEKQVIHSSKKPTPPELVIHSSKKPTSPELKKKVEMANVGSDVGATRGSAPVADSQTVETIEGKVEKIYKEFETMKYLIAEQQRKMDERLEKGLSDLPFMKFLLILIIVLLLLHLSLY